MFLQFVIAAAIFFLLLWTTRHIPDRSQEHMLRSILITVFSLWLLYFTVTLFSHFFRAWWR